jgi:hypothetical protein
MTLSQRSAQSIVGAAGEFPREANDFYATPRPAIRALLAVEKFSLTVWEPCVGDGEIAAVLRAFGYSVVGTDLVDRGAGESGVDYLKTTALRAPNVVTNPPFKLAEPFIRHSLDLGATKAAFLLRLQFLEGARRRKMFESTPFARCWVFSKRIPRMHNPDYTGPKTTSLIAFAWFVWDAAHIGPATIGFINPDDKLTAYEDVFAE